MSKEIKSLEFSQTKRMNNATSKKCKIICQWEDICKRAPGVGGGLVGAVAGGQVRRGTSTGISCQG